MQTIETLIEEITALAAWISVDPEETRELTALLALVFRVRDEALARVKTLEGIPLEKERADLVEFLKTNFPELCSVDAWPAERAIFMLRRLRARVKELETALDKVVECMKNSAAKSKIVYIGRGAIEAAQAALKGTK